MKVLFVNKFFYIKGGAENSMFQTAKVLERHGHDTVYFSMFHEKNIQSEWNKYFVSNIDYDTQKLKEQISVASKLLYSFEARRKIEILIKQTQPDLVHLNNTYHQISPSILHAIKKFNLPVVMSLRDYKLVCANQRMFNHQGLCELCENGTYYHCLLNKCSKNSTMKSFLNMVEMYLHHNIMKIYDNVHLCISPSRFLKSKVEKMGFNGEIRHLFNFVDLNEFMPCFEFKDKSIVYIGRLSEEKGILTLVNAVKHVDVELKIVGDGPIVKNIENKVRHENIRNVKFLGHMTGADLYNQIRSSMCVIVPSEWYENNPRSVVESFALGKPVIGADIGGIPEMVIPGKTGFLFKPGDSDDLKDKINIFVDNPGLIGEYGRNARRFAEKELDADKQYEKLMHMYEQAITKSTRTP